MIVARTIGELRGLVASARGRGERVGLVPTMGALHEGHLSLIRRARERCAYVVVSLFVNPAQFSETQDLSRYPRDEGRDAELAEGAGAHMLFAPTVEEIYPPRFATTVEVFNVSESLEGAIRGPKHFRGVATVVTKLLNITQPDAAYFGQKDAQQALLIQRLVRDLDMPVEIEVCPTVREPNGLAMSSRNVLLDAAARRRAPVLSQALFAVRDAVASGERDTRRALVAGARLLADAGIEPEYFAAVSSETLRPMETIAGEVLVVLAARLGDVRLIDNVLVHAPESAT